MAKYDNSGRLEEVGEKDWQEALDELTAYLRWRLRGKTRWGAHSEKVLEIPALDYYTEEAVAKLIVATGSGRSATRWESGWCRLRGT